MHFLVKIRKTNESESLKMKSKKFWLKAFIWTGSILTLLTLTLIIGLYAYAKVTGAPDLAVTQTNIFYAENGDIIGETSDGHRRLWVELDEISPHFINAILSVEDQNFYTHAGIDIKRIGGALIADIKAGKKVQGASTISQQYAKNLYLSSEKTWRRKAEEALYAFRIEANYSKEEILTGYLNTIYFGHGMYGIEAASEYYFHKPASELSIAESAMLAGIPKGPNIYSPFVSKENAKKRQQTILRLLVQNNKITEEERITSADEQLTYYGTKSSFYEHIGHYFQDEVRKEVAEILSDKPKILAQGGLRIHTTLHADYQRKTEEIALDTLPENSEIQLAIITMEPQTGAVRSMVGGRSYLESPFNRATQGKRQPGSTIKPLLYYAALENGFTPSTSMRSEETIFTYDKGRQEYKPHNYNQVYANKEITMAQALALSDNIYAVKTHLFIGENELVQAGKRFGIQSDLQKVPSLALGTSEVHPLEMTNAFNFFANDGQKVEPYYVEKITNYKGDIIYERQLPQSEQVLDSAKAFVIAQMLTGIFDTRLNDYASVTGSSIINRLTREYAAKSGSTSSDSWMIGFSPELTTGVWVGYDDGRRLEHWTDKKYAKDIWADVMEAYHEAIPVAQMSIPNDVEAVHIDPLTGLLANENCPIARLTYFTKGTAPIESCYLHGQYEQKEFAPERPSAPEKQEAKEEKKPWYRRWF